DCGLSEHSDLTEKKCSPAGRSPGDAQPGAFPAQKPSSLKGMAVLSSDTIKCALELNCDLPCTVDAQNLTTCSQMRLWATRPSRLGYFRLSFRELFRCTLPGIFGVTVERRPRYEKGRS